MVRSISLTLPGLLLLSFDGWVFPSPPTFASGSDAASLPQRDDRELELGPSSLPSSQPSGVPWNTPPTLQPSSDAPTQQPTKSPTAKLTTSQTKGPHFVMVVIDDMGFGDLGFKGSGIRTPTMDKLAATGTHLTNYYVLPACTHSRVAIMSGKYPYRSGIYKVVEPGRTFGMKSTDRTLANVLRARGYRAHAVGKWHLGSAWYDYLPTFRGFESFLGIWANGGYFNYSTLGAGNAYEMRWDMQEFCDKNCSRLVDYRGKYSTKVFTDRAVKVIDEHDPNADPLFLYLAYQGVHTPYEVPSSYKQPYKSKPWSEGKKTYAGMLSAVDEGIGRVVQALKDNGLWKDTVLIVTTDNGAPLSSKDSSEGFAFNGFANATATNDDNDVNDDNEEVPPEGAAGGAVPLQMDFGGSNFPLRGKKLQIFEGGIRADGIVSGPGCAKLGIKPGKNPHLFHAIDWLPTLEALTYRNSPGPVRKGIDGVSQKRSLRGGPANRDEAFLGYGVKSRNNPIPRMVAAYRQGSMKLIRYVNGEYLLYDLAKDLRETTNLIGKAAYRRLVSNMKRKLHGFDGSFTKATENLGHCPARRYGKTSWGQKAWIPWCERDYRTPLLPGEDVTRI